MKDIVSVFRPWLDTRPDVNIYHTDDAGWCCLTTLDDEPVLRSNLDRKTLLIVLTCLFFESVASRTWSGGVFQTIQEMQPYMDQLSQEDAEIIRSTLGLFLRFDEERFPRNTALS